MERNSFRSRRLRLKLAKLSATIFLKQEDQCKLHTFVSIFGEDAILTDAARDEEAYASRMKGGGVVRWLMSRW
jgi:hypothetical protein